MRSQKRLLASLVAAAMLITAGCSGEADKPAAAPRTESTPTPAPPLTVAQYKALLAGMETALRPLIAQAVTAPTLPATDAARVRLAKVLEQNYQTLDSVKPPPAWVSLNRSVQMAMISYNSLQKTFSTGMLEKKTDCGVPKTVPELLYEARRDIYYTVKSASFENAVKDLAKVKISFGKNLFPAPPPDPPNQNRRGVNGQVLQRSGPRGNGRLQITNDSDSDAVVVVSTAGPKKPQASIYVRSGSQATLTGIRGTYSVYVKTGMDWDAARRQFTGACNYESFLQFFDQRSNWKISLGKRKDGNALTNEIPAF
ncbi:hypothetical protein [Kribbella sp. CA-294648]|uniref:hypothetical protein n=1 Tax=Kribbella sp. CA-294648 TaxID=3239948 RepID=UPI003D9327D2